MTYVGPVIEVFGSSSRDIWKFLEEELVKTAEGSPFYCANINQRNLIIPSRDNQYSHHIRSRENSPLGNAPDEVFTIYDSQICQFMSDYAEPIEQLSDRFEDFQIKMMAVHEVL